MKIKFQLIFILSVLCLGLNNVIAGVNGNVSGTGDNIIAFPVPDSTVMFSISDTGVYKPIIWGLDLAWLSEENVRRGIGFMGKERVDVIRSSFTPTSPIVDGKLQTQEMSWINQRLKIIDLLGPDTKVVLNCDHPSVNSWFIGNAARWAELIDISTRLYQEHGRKVITVSPFNEPDYGWGQGTQTDFYNIAGELRKNPRFDSIRICGGNTLNTDQALPWYNALKSRLDEGNTHQLAGTFNNYANFYKAVRANGHHATNDELHNVMEAMVGVQYGMQTGIWWGTAEYARGEFVKASDGRRLGYAEHRSNWTAASVYRTPEGKVQAFGGTSERQAKKTTYSYISRDRDVFYDGYGPQREYSLTLPGGTGYQEGQTNAERVVNITWGDDIQPVINGKYILVNRNSGKVIEVPGGSTASGINIKQNASNGASYQQWNVVPVDPTIGGDFSYFLITAGHNGKSMDILNWSLTNGGNIIVYDLTKGTNQQWYLEYVEDGWFRIRSRFSSKCLDVYNSSTANSMNIVHNDPNNSKSQQWRLIPVSNPVEFVSPAAPVNLSSSANATSVRLDWSANTESDLSGYNVYRADTSGGSFNTIARNVQNTSFIDNTVETGKQYFYKIKAFDKSLNSSGYSNEVSLASIGGNDMITHFTFEGNTFDSSINLNHGATFGGASFVDVNAGTKALLLNGTDGFVQLPANIANHKEITVATWVKWNGGDNYQRIFDFSFDKNNYMYLTPKNFYKLMFFAIKNGGTEQKIITTALAVGKWAHVAVTLGKTGAAMYVDGVQVAQSGTITLSPLDFKPILNYIGRGYYVSAMLGGSIDDFRIYNYELNAGEVSALAKSIPDGINNTSIQNKDKLVLWPLPAKDILNVRFNKSNSQLPAELSVFDLNGRLVITRQVSDNCETTLNIKGLNPGLYFIKLTVDHLNTFGRFNVLN
jgi:hypothetical protein